MSVEHPNLDPMEEALALINALLDGRLSAEEARRLEALIRERVDVRRMYVRLLHQECVMRPHARLAVPPLVLRHGTGDDSSQSDDREYFHETMVLPALHGGAGEQEELLRPPPLPRNGPVVVPWWRRHVTAIAASLLLVVGLALFLIHRHPSTPSSFATIAGSVQLTWDREDVPTRMGAALPESELRLKSGAIELAFAGGAHVLVEAPARFTTTAANQISLRGGQLTAVVPPRAVGFTVATPAGKLVDLGTEFGVILKGDGTAAVEVFIGKVRAEPQKPVPNAPKATVLTAGQAASVTTSAVSPEPPRPERFVRKLADFSRPVAATTPTAPVRAPSAGAPATVPSGVVRVDLMPNFNHGGIIADDAAFSDGGIDGGGMAYSSAQLASVGDEFQFGSPGINNVVAAVGQTIQLPEGQYGSLVILGAGINGKKPDLEFIVRYTDGTSRAFTQSMSNWNSPSSFPGETTLTMGSRIVEPGKIKKLPTYVYRYSFPLDRGKKISTLLLPRAPQTAAILAINLAP